MRRKDLHLILVNPVSAFSQPDFRLIDQWKRWSTDRA